MRVEKHDAGPAKRILAAMITDPAVCGRIAAHWSGGLFRGKWENIVGGWCAKYFTKYETAPGVEIETAFRAWAADAKDDATVQLVESFLQTISKEYEKRRPDSAEYIIDLAAEHFNENRMLSLADEIKTDIANGDRKRAAERLNAYHRIELGTGGGVDVIQDKAAIKAALTDAAADYFSYDGGLKYFFDGMLGPDIFLAFQAPMKRGKTFWQIDMAWRAMLARRRVAFFEIGDMSQNQIMRRFAVRATGRPLKRTTAPVLWPRRLEMDGNKAIVTHKSGKWGSDLNWETAWKACKKIVGDLESKESFLRLSCHPSGTINVPGIAGILAGWERKKWCPEIVVIDYADLLAPISQKDMLHAIDENWSALRGLSESRHCLVVTATQAKAAAFGVETMNEGHFAQNNRKMAHVVGMVGINMTHREKREGLCRLNWLQRREGDFDIEAVCHVAGCLAVAQPAIKSIF
jgi:hypothetical protein